MKPNLARLDAIEASLRAALAGIEELRRQLSGDVMTPYELASAFSEEWAKWYRGDNYTPTPRDMREAKTLVTKYSAGDLRTRLVRYLENRDGFYLGQRHPLSLFATQINRFGAATPVKTTKTKFGFFDGVDESGGHSSVG